MKAEDNETKNLIRAWTIAIASLTYCYLVPRNLPKGLRRLISLLPVITIFTFLPLTLSSIHSISVALFFFTWLGNFKLLLLAFNQGPLSSPTLSLPRFISLASLPIQINPSSKFTKKGLNSPLNYSIKLLLIVVVLNAYAYRSLIHTYIIQGIYGLHVYLTVELTLAVAAVPARAVFGFEMEPQFDDPYMSTSLQDFWGRRWNLMVPSILRPTVYLPIRYFLTPVIGRKGGLVAAMMSSFLVSGLMHELLYFYVTRVSPTWEITCFFVLHGVCTVVEIEMKKMLKGKWELHPVVSGFLTLGFAWVTCIWLFFPQAIRTGVDVKAIEEYGVLVEFIKNAIMSSLDSSST